MTCSVHQRTLRSIAVACACTVVLAFAVLGFELGSSRVTVPRTLLASTSSDSRRPTNQPPPQRQRHDVVLGCLYATDPSTPVDLRWVLVYILSLHANRHAADTNQALRLVLFTDTATKERLEHTLLEQDAPVTGFLELLDFDWEATFPGQRWANVTLLPEAAAHFQFALFRDFIAANNDRINRVMTSDITDLAFQDNPFSGCSVPAAAPDDPVVVFTLENENRHFDDDNHEHRMPCYPTSVLRFLKSGQKALANSGAMLGTVSGMSWYLNMMTEQLQDDAIVDCAISVVKHSVVHAAHHYIYHIALNTFKDLHPDVRVVTARHHQACAYHGTYAEGDMMPDDVVVNSERNPYPIVHQFAACRQPRIMEALATKYLQPTLRPEKCTHHDVSGALNRANALVLRQVAVRRKVTRFIPKKRKR